MKCLRLIHTFARKFTYFASLVILPLNTVKYFRYQLFELESDSPDIIVYSHLNARSICNVFTVTIDDKHPCIVGGFFCHRSQFGSFVFLKTGFYSFIRFSDNANAFMYHQFSVKSFAANNNTNKNVIVLFARN